MLNAVRALNPDAYNPVSTRPDIQRGILRRATQERKQAG